MGGYLLGSFHSFQLEVISSEEKIQGKRVEISRIKEEKKNKRIGI